MTQVGDAASASLSPDWFKQVRIERLPAPACWMEDHRVQRLAHVGPLLGNGKTAFFLGLVPALSQRADVGGAGLVTR